MELRDLITKDGKTFYDVKEIVADKITVMDTTTSYIITFDLDDSWVIVATNYMDKYEE